MTKDDEYSPFKRDPETTAMGKKLLKTDRESVSEEKDKAIIDAVESQGINFANIEQGLRAKDRIIRDVCGYKVLQIGAGKFEELDYCTPERRNSALRDMYEAAKKRISGG